MSFFLAIVYCVASAKDAEVTSVVNQKVYDSANCMGASTGTSTMTLTMNSDNGGFKQVQESVGAGPGATSLEIASTGKMSSSSGDVHTVFTSTDAAGKKNVVSTNAKYNMQGDSCKCMTTSTVTEAGAVSSHMKICMVCDGTLEVHTDVCEDSGCVTCKRMHTDVMEYSAEDCLKKTHTNELVGSTSITSTKITSEASSQAYRQALGLPTTASKKCTAIIDAGYQGATAEARMMRDNGADNDEKHYARMMRDYNANDEKMYHSRARDLTEEFLRKVQARDNTEEEQKACDTLEQHPEVAFMQLHEDAVETAWHGIQQDCSNQRRARERAMRSIDQGRSLVPAAERMVEEMSRDARATRYYRGGDDKFGRRLAPEQSSASKSHDDQNLESWMQEL